MQAQVVTKKKDFDNPYALKVGKRGKGRLDLLDKVYGAFSRDSLKPILKEGMDIATFGCGTGNLEIWMSSFIGKKGTITAYDISEEQLEIARLRASALGLKNIDFVCADICEIDNTDVFDLVHCRYLLMHLHHPQQAIKKMTSLLKKEGLIFLEEVSTAAGFSDPKNHSIYKGLSLMNQISKINRTNYKIGEKLFGLLTQEYIGDIQIKSYQPLYSVGEEKTSLIESIKEASESLINKDIVTQAELAKIIAAMEYFIQDPKTLIGLPISYQAQGTKI